LTPSCVHFFFREFISLSGSTHLSQPRASSPPSSSSSVRSGDSAAIRVADAVNLRRAFANFATGVTVITALDEHGVAIGMTANSFGSVSLEPPLVQWSLRINSGLHRAFVHAEQFCVSVLAANQEDIARQFSCRAPDRFEGVSLLHTNNEPPLIANAIAHFVCRRINDYRVGDHELFVGEVLRAHTFEGEPLIFHASKFTALAK
jgi:flavin reductase (DIM6/NTAB) family NADH-FMN oxidoreductase RutF